MASNTKYWLAFSPEKQIHKIRLFCFHHAGGAASYFRSWNYLLSEIVDVLALQLPGREMRYTEELITDFKVLLDDIYNSIKVYLDKPFVFFGHSMGAIVAYELARRLKENNLPSPFHLIVSGSEAPHRKNTSLPIHDLPDHSFIETLKRYEGLPIEILEHQDLIESLMPRFRADFLLSEKYEYKKGELLDCPITVFIGTKDLTTEKASIFEWQKQTKRTFNYKNFSGGHFFINEQKTKIIEEIKKIILTK